MLDIQVNNVVREVKDGDTVVGIIPDISLGSYTPVARLQVLCIADEMAELGAEKTEQLTRQLVQVGILDAFMHYVKELSLNDNPQIRYALIEQMKIMRSRYADILQVTRPGKRSSFWDFFTKREAVLQDVVRQVTPVQLMGVLMHAHSEYLQARDESTRSFLARGILAGVEDLRSKKLGPMPQVKHLLRASATQKRQEFPVMGRRLSSRRINPEKISFGCWYNPSKWVHKVVCKSSKNSMRYGDGFASRFSPRSY